MHAYENHIIGWRFHIYTPDERFRCGMRRSIISVLNPDFNAAYGEARSSIHGTSNIGFLEKI